MRATGSGYYYMCATVSSKWQTLEMGHILTSGAHYVTEDLITKNKFGRGSNYVRGDTYWMVRANWNP